MATINISNKLKKELKTILQELGLLQKNLLLNALLHYYQILKNKIGLKKELKISREATNIYLIKFEQIDKQRRYLYCKDCV